ncbi:putative F-box/kelch-repeat protein At1g15680 [Mercurialis annua]|uniref:putative F-box/kelch-repeat protein At1g15680 n=1 Tax=Mercurialis annua TaxID=3986 RepID=UPI00215F799D|nr:putative F-box/kelch-repeat protein At1g15680 [Mercurialis annua]
MARKRKKTALCLNEILTDDLLVEILHRIPCKSAFQCKSVCKKWRKLISKTYFTRCFARRHRSDHRKKRRELGEEGVVVKRSFNHLFFIPSEYKHQFSFDFLPFFSSKQKNPTTFIAGSSNNLFLCTADQAAYYVCNPMTNHWIALPPPPPLLESVHIYPGLVVFGSSMSRTTFKVIRVLVPVTGEKKLSEFEVDVFCSITGKWGRLKTGPSPKPFIWSVRRSPAICYRGRLHWIATSENQMVVYDVRKNSFCFIIEPPKNSTKHSVVPALSGAFYVAQFSKRSSKLKLWQLDYPDNEQAEPKWRFKGKFMLHEYVRHGRRWLTELFIKRVLTIHRHDRNIIYLGANSEVWYLAGKFRCHRYVVSCNLRTKTLDLVYESQNDLFHRADYAYSIGFRMWPPPISPARP